MMWRRVVYEVTEFLAHCLTVLTVVVWVFSFLLKP